MDLFRLPLRRRIREAAICGFGVGVRPFGTLEGGTQLGGFLSRPLELGGVASNTPHLTTWRETSATQSQLSPSSESQQC